MRKMIAYIACSLDGKISDKDGAVDWLDRIPNPDKSDYGYFDFYAGIDTTIMGGTTYKDVLGFNVPFPYPEKTNYVITRDREVKVMDAVTLVHDLTKDWVQELKASPGKDIWLVGGSFLNTWMLQHGFLDEMRLFVMPVVLGEGTPLFVPGTEEVSGELINSTTYSTGVIELRYRFRNS